MRLDELFFIISSISQILIFFVIKKNENIYKCITISLGIVILSGMFFWNNAILIDELGTNGSVLSFGFFVISVFMFLLNVCTGIIKKNNLYK